METGMVVLFCNLTSVFKNSKSPRANPNTEVVIKGVVANFTKCLCGLSKVSIASMAALETALYCEFMVIFNWIVDLAEGSSTQGKMLLAENGWQCVATTWLLEVPVLGSMKFVLKIPKVTSWWVFMLRILPTY